MRAEKQLLLDEIKDQMDRHDSFVIMSYLGLKAHQAHQLRNKVREAGGDVEVMAKRMLVIAAKSAGYEIDLNSLTGHIGVVFAGEDPIETTKLVYEFHKEYKDNISVVGGRIDGQILDGNEMEALSKLPGKQEMRAQLLAVLQAPSVQTVSVMHGLVASVMYALENKSKQMQG